MKHILNNISQEEKNRILEQHSGGKTIDTTKFKNLLESTLGNVKQLVEEEETVPVTSSNKITPIQPKNYESVKQMVARTLKNGETVNITISNQEAKIDGPLKGVTGTLPSTDITKILP